MERRTYRFLLAAVLATILAVPSISTADGPPIRIAESFELGETGCKMTVFMEQDGSGMIGANVGPANIPSPPCRLDCNKKDSCPPSPCCIWDRNKEGCNKWNCSTVGEGKKTAFLCASFTHWDGKEKKWVTGDPCPPVPGPGGKGQPTCNLNHVNKRPMSGSLICDDCAGPPDSNGFYNCTHASCLPFTAVERNIMEKHGDNSQWCYYSAGFSACAH